MTYAQACQRARKHSHKGPRYVVRESTDPVEYDVARETELDSWFDGAPVLACYINGERQDD